MVVVFRLGFLLAVILVCAGARAQRAVFSLYTGNTHTLPSDVHIVQPSTNSDFTIRGMRFEASWHRESLYYGSRLGTWFGGDTPIGADLEFRHHKLFGRVNDLRPVDGTVRGEKITAVRQVNEFVRDFRLTDGVNTFNTNIYVRESFDGSRKWRAGAASAYTAVAPSYYITYVHSDINGVSHPKGLYHGVGGGANFFIGVRYGITDRIGFFTELGYSSGRRKTVDIGQGGTATLDIRTFHYNAGMSYTILD